ncbi:hypothetical protein BpHYR1_007569 [Brachionus plicatilis]|uniref:Uncharacterized protein n=1 Tax=Brachionus plicatilis TaxID=10195 RepID=A0A3M7TAI9_BRAPC|nr:hypothetical protein BpHYR1_007569 [Brachionus plicatilis]
MHQNVLMLINFRFFENIFSKLNNEHEIRLSICRITVVPRYNEQVGRKFLCSLYRNSLKRDALSFFLSKFICHFFKQIYLSSIILIAVFFVVSAPSLTQILNGNKIRQAPEQNSKLVHLLISQNLCYSQLKLRIEVQKRAAKVPHTLRPLDYRKRCKLLELTSLDDRRIGGNVTQNTKPQRDWNPLERSATQYP